MPTLGELNVRIGANIQNLERALGKAEAQLRRSGRKLASLGSELTQSISIPVLGLGAASIVAAGKFEQLSNSLTSIMGDAGAAQKEIELLRKEAQKPGLGLEQAVRGSVRLQSVGLNADLARKALANFGNALSLAGGSAADLDGVTLALTQIISKGKISAEEINQLAERVPQVRAAITAAFGTSDSEALQKLGIGVEDFVEKVTDEIGKLPQATGGINNAIQNTGQAITNFLVTIGNDINKTFDIQGKIEAFSDKLNNIAQAFSNLSPQTKKAIMLTAGFAAAIGPAIFVLGKMKLALAAIVGGIKMAFSLSTLSSLLSPWTLAIAGIAALGVLVYKNWDVVKKAIINVTNSVIGLYNNFLPLRFIVVNIGLQFTTLWKTVKVVLKNMLNGFNALFRAISQALSGDFQEAGQTIKDAFKKGMGDMKAHGQDIAGDFADGLQEVLHGRIQEVGLDAFKTLEDKASNIKGVVQGIMNDLTATTTDTPPGEKKRGFKAPAELNTILTRLPGQTAAAAGGFNTITIAAQSAIEKLGELETTEPAMTAFQQRVQGIRDTMESLRVAINQIINAGLENSFLIIGQAIGIAIGKGQKFSGFIKELGISLFRNVMTVMESLGKAIIASAIAMEAFQKMIKFAVNPFVAIGAGIALIALSKALPGLLSKKVDAFAGGTNFAPGGMALVGERGPELVNLPRGSQVIPNHKIGMGSGGGQLNARLEIDGEKLVVLINEVNRRRGRLGI